MRTCPVCDVDFEPNPSRRQIYCSGRCQERAGSRANYQRHGGTPEYKLQAKIRKAAHRKANPEKARLQRAANYQRNKAQVRAWELANADRVRRWKAEWVERNRDLDHARQARRRFRLGISRRSGRTMKLRPGDWAVILSAYRNKCAYCGVGGPLTKDHVIPLKKGGAHVMANIVPACRSCNSRKADKPAPKPVRLLLL